VNSQLAGVLAGFMVVAITTLLLMTNVPRRSIAHSLAVFATGVVVLGLDAYLFASVAATKPPATAWNAAIYCRQAWVQVMPASGLLATGAVLLISGIGWMLVQYSINDSSPHKKLIQLGVMLTGMVMFATASLLMYTSFLFVNQMAGEFRAITSNAKFAAMVVAILGGVVILGWPILVMTRKTFGLMFRIERPVHWTEVTDPRYKVIEWLSAITGFYVMFCVIVPMVLNTWKSFAGWHITALHLLWWGIVLCLLMPGLLFGLIATSMPGRFGPIGRCWRRGWIWLRVRPLRDRFAGKELQYAPKHFSTIQRGDIAIELGSGHHFIVSGGRKVDSNTFELQLVRTHLGDDETFDEVLTVTKGKYRKSDIVLMRPLKVQVRE
jgi:hypothetical protein